LPSTWREEISVKNLCINVLDKLYLVYKEKIKISCCYLKITKSILLIQKKKKNYKKHLMFEWKFSLKCMIEGTRWRVQDEIFRSGVFVFCVNLWLAVIMIPKETNPPLVLKSSKDSPLSSGGGMGDQVQ
jgi:hypothetical protein